MNSTIRKAAVTAYQSAVMTTPPLQAVVLLFDGILVRVHNAEVAAMNRDYERQFNETSRAVDILRGLLAALDLTRGGDVARRLHDTYAANMLALMHAVGRPDGAECCHRIGDGLRQLRDAWAEIAGVAPSSGPRPDA